MMATLYDTFRDYEIDLLEMITEHWGIEDAVNWRKEPANQIAVAIRDKALFTEIVTSLPEPAQAAFHMLAEKGGRIEREVFARKYGDVREMGAAVREKERPDRVPCNESETLFYRGLIALAFFEVKGETKEYYFIPDEFLIYSQQASKTDEMPSLQPLASSKKIDISTRDAPDLLQMLTLRLAILRGNITETEFGGIIQIDAIPFLDALLKENGILDKDRNISTSEGKTILLEEETDLLRELYKNWYKSEQTNDLRMVPELEFDGQWVNNPIKPRKAIVDMIQALHAEQWYQLEEMVQWIYETSPHFMRFGGEYEQWFIKKRGREEYLHGFDAWPEVDGAYARYLISGPLHWLGMIELGQQKGADENLLFKKHNTEEYLIDKKPNETKVSQPQRAIIHKNGEIYLPIKTEREMLYHFARFCIWNGKNESYFKFKLTPDAIRRAADQQVSISHIETIFRKYGQEPIPDNIFTLLSRWKKSGAEIEIEEQVIVRFKDPKTLKQLNNKIIQNLIMDILNPTTVIIRKQDLRKFENALVEAGYLAENRCKYNEIKIEERRGTQ